jgi:hypothetical protein
MGKSGNPQLLRGAFFLTPRFRRIYDSSRWEEGSNFSYFIREKVFAVELILAFGHNSSIPFASMVLSLGITTPGNGKAVRRSLIGKTEIKRRE